MKASKAKFIDIYNNKTTPRFFWYYVHGVKQEVAVFA